MKFDEKDVISESREILSQYAQKCSTIDEGNLYFAATQFEKAYERLQAEVQSLDVKLAISYRVERWQFESLTAAIKDLEKKLKAENERLKEIEWKYKELCK